MERTTYPYEKPEVDLKINKMPIWFREIEFNGDEAEGTIILRSKNDYDEIWGSNAKMEISWEKMERENYLHARAVQQSIDMYNAIDIVITKKETIWVRSHEFTYWLGNRTKMIRKHYYPENSIHGIFFCDVSGRIFNLHTKIIREHYEGFKEYILDSYKSVICH
jgi:hypothetical protein